MMGDIVEPEEPKVLEPTPPPLYEKGTRLYERDGDLNPTWIFVTCFIALGLVLCIAAIASRNALALIAAMSFCAMMIVALLMSALPINKAKILSRAKLGDIGRGVTGRAREYGGSTEEYDPDDFLDG
jgi:hypothetical protein